MSLDEKDKKLGEALARVRDGLQGLQPAIEAIDAFINHLGKAIDAEHSSDLGMTKIAWVKAEGEKGPYEKTDDVDNPDYKKLRQALKEHDGKMQLQGFFLWTFQDGSTIGRKPLGKKA